MAQPLRIAVADDEKDMREYLVEILPRLGHEVVCAAANGRELVEQCARLKPDLVIVDVKMPDMNGLEAAERLFGSGPIPVIVVSAYHDPEFIEGAQQSHVLAYLIKPISQEDLVAAIAIARSRFEEFQGLRKEAASLRQALDDRKIIERAKGILMKYAQIDEPAAFRRLQKVASSKNQKLVDIAHMVVTTMETFQAAQDDSG